MAWVKTGSSGSSGAMVKSVHGSTAALQTSVQGMLGQMVKQKIRPYELFLLACGYFGVESLTSYKLL